MRRYSILVLVLLLLAACKTVGISHQDGGYAEVSVNIAHQMLLDDRQILVLDIRPAEAYAGATGHIAGSVSAPLATIEQRLPQLIPYQSGTVLVYGDSESSSKDASKLLVASGFRNVVRIEGGIDRWIEKGYETVTVH